MTTAFVVCWILMHGATAGQQSCTPEMSYTESQMIMAAIIRAGDYTTISMTEAPSAPARPPITVPAPPAKEDPK